MQNYKFCIKDHRLTALLCTNYAENQRFCCCAVALLVLRDASVCIAYSVIDPDVCLRVKIILCPHRIIHSSDMLDKADWVLSKLPIILKTLPVLLLLPVCVCVSPLVHYYLIYVSKTLICKA